MTLKLKSELERLERLKIIEKQEAPTKWVSHMVVVRKPNNHIRICLDPNPLNKAFSPGAHPTKVVSFVCFCCSREYELVLTFSTAVMYF